MKKKMKQICVGFGVVALLATLCWMPLAADAARSERKPPAVDAEVYIDFMASQPQDIKDLVDEAELQRDFFNRITPPNVLLFQPMMPLVVPFNDSDFTDAFLEGLLGEDRNSVAVYPLSLSLDPKTYETLIHNAEGNLIATLPSDKESHNETTDSDPSRVTLLLDLLPSEDVEPYLYTESRIEESLASTKSRMPKSGGMAMKSLGATEFGISGIQTLTNGAMRITVSNGTDFAELFAYTVEHTSTVSGSNTFWAPASPAFNGIESAWECQTTNLLLTNGVGIWEDSNISSNDRIRFYAAAKRIDTDSDSLTDGTEIFLNRTDTADIDTDGDDLLDGYDLAVDDQDSRYELWATAGIVYVDDGGLRTFSGELSAETDPLDPDTDDDGLTDGVDPEPTQFNAEPIVRFRHPFDTYQFEGPAQIALESDWLYSSESPSQVVYQVISDLTGITNEIPMAADGSQTTNWYAPPGDFTLRVRGIDATGQTGEMHSVTVTIDENPSFTALSPADQQEVLTNGPRAVEGMPEIFYSYADSTTTGDVTTIEIESGSHIAAAFANATNFTVIPVTNAYLGVGYEDRELMRNEVSYNTPTTNLEATLYGVSRWGARVESDLPQAPIARTGYAAEQMLVFDQNEKGEWVGKIYPGLSSVDEVDPFSLLHLGYGMEGDAFLYQTGSFEALVAPSNYNGQDDIRLVFGLNNEGVMVGACFDYETGSGGSWIEDYQPIVYRSGQTGTLLSVSTQALGGATYAVNDAGVIVGCEIFSGEVPRAVQWLDGSPMEIGGLTNATESVAYDISEDGVIAGMKKVNGQWEPFLTGPDGSNLLATATFDGVAFREFWHISKFGALGWSSESNSAQRLYWVIPDNDQDGFSDIIEQEIVDATPFLTNIVDVVASGDYDGDGLSNLEEWELKTDSANKDSDGDRIPDGLDPLPLTYRDTDGDGLPDDWETHYGLDPASASGADGASGDPDGDGLTNLDEFRLDGDPTDENSPGYRFHRERISQLRVDLPDSTNCGWTPDPWSFIDMHQTIQFVEKTDPNLPPMEFIFKVSVTGRVAVAGAEYAQATVNEVEAFASWMYTGFGCEMTNISEDILATVYLSPGEVTLRYESFDGYYHVGAFAEVTDIQLVQVNTNFIYLDLDIWNGGSDLDNGQVAGSQGSRVADDDEESVGAYLLVNWDDDDDDGSMNDNGTWSAVPVSDLTEDSVANEDNLAQLKPTVQPLLDTGSIELEVSGSDAGKVKLWTQSTKGTQVTLASNKKTWNLADSTEKADFQSFINGGYWIEGIEAGTAERAVTFTLRYKDSGGTEISNDVCNATVIMINLANAVYRDNTWPLIGDRGHSSLVCSYVGTCTRSALTNDASFMLIEMVDVLTDANNLTRTTQQQGIPFYGCFHNPTMSYVDRLRIISAARALVTRANNIGYSPENALEPVDWNGNLDTITTLRCDGLIEACYEINDVDVWGMERDADSQTVHYDIGDQNDTWSYNGILGTWSTGANSEPDNLEEHNDFDSVGDWDDTLQPATQCGHVALEEADTQLEEQDLCQPIGSTGGN